MSDGETIPVDLETLSDRLREGHVSLIFVQVWRRDEAVFDDKGVATPLTVPTPRRAGRCGSSPARSARP